jgi:hypothetical protein
MVGEFRGRKLLGCRYFDGIALISLYEDEYCATTARPWAKR